MDVAIDAANRSSEKLLITLNKCHKNQYMDEQVSKGRCHYVMHYPMFSGQAEISLMLLC